MHVILSAIIVIGALFDMAMGIGFFLNPVSSGSSFGLDAGGAMGISALRADFTAFFVVSAVFMAWGAWKRLGYLLVVPLALFLVAFTGRLVTLLVNGAYDGWWMPMSVELSHVVVLALAIRAWDWHPVSA